MFSVVTLSVFKVSLTCATGEALVCDIGLAGYKERSEIHG